MYPSVALRFRASSREIVISSSVLTARQLAGLVRRLGSGSRCVEHNARTRSFIPLTQRCSLLLFQSRFLETSQTIVSFTFNCIYPLIWIWRNTDTAQISMSRTPLSTISITNLPTPNTHGIATGRDLYAQDPRTPIHPFISEVDHWIEYIGQRIRDLEERHARIWRSEDGNNHVPGGRIQRNE